jgi:hypothetical protein
MGMPKLPFKSKEEEIEWEKHCFIDYTRGTRKSLKEWTITKCIETLNFYPNTKKDFINCYEKIFGEKYPYSIDTEKELAKKSELLEMERISGLKTFYNIPAPIPPPSFMEYLQSPTKETFEIF